MRLQKRLDFKVFGENQISYGNRFREVRQTQGTSPEDFCQTYDKLSKQGLAVTEEFLTRFYDEVYGKSLSLSETQELPFPHISHLVGFVLDAGYLLGKGVDIKPLIKGLNMSGNVDELHHSCHLSSLAANCVSVGRKVRFQRTSKNKKTADFVVDGISADLKIVHPPDVEKLHKEKGEVFETEVGGDVCYDIGKAIENRLCIGIKQSELVFVNLAAKSLPNVFWGNVLQDFPDKYSIIMPELKKFRVIFYFELIPPNILNRRIKGALPYSFYGTYVDIDPNLWLFVRETNTKIIWEKGQGKYIMPKSPNIS